MFIVSAESSSEAVSKSTTRTLLPTSCLQHGALHVPHVGRRTLADVGRAAPCFRAWSDSRALPSPAAGGRSWAAGNAAWQGSGLAITVPAGARGWMRTRQILVPHVLEISSWL